MIGTVDRKTTSRIKKWKAREFKRRYVISPNLLHHEPMKFISSCERVDSASTASDSAGDVHMQFI